MLGNPVVVRSPIALLFSFATFAGLLLALCGKQAFRRKVRGGVTKDAKENEAASLVETRFDKLMS
jgi:hypothetical protein